MRGASNITDLEEQRLAEPLLKVQVVIVVVGVAEILADRKNIINLSAAISSGAQTSGSRKNRLAGYDGSRSRHGRDRIHRASTGWVTFQAVGSTVCGTIVEEWIQIRRVEINSKSGTDHEVATFLRFIGESQSWSEISKVLWINAGDTS